jgi:hypothetical protein
MRPLADWRSDAARLSAEEFCTLHRYPLLIHCKTSGELQPVDQTHGLTIDRAIISDRRDDNSRWSAALSDYGAFVVKTRQAGRSVDVTIGCSSQCDIQIDDISISKLHALMIEDRSGWHVRDASSLTGVRVNDTDVGDDPSGFGDPLCSGDRITFGVVDLIFLLPREVFQLVRGLNPG